MSAAPTTEIDIGTSCNDSVRRVAVTMTSSSTAAEFPFSCARVAAVARARGAAKREDTAKRVSRVSISLNSRR